jgi:polar amino acid transport system ATP-binding protein
LTALENVALPLEKVHGFKPSEADQRAMEVLARFDLASHASKQPSQLSGGQQQRVALARAIAPKPRLLLLDEPTSALDPVMTHEVLDVVRDLAESGQQLVLSTHEVNFARLVSDWVLFLDKGRVIESRPAKDFFESPDSPEAIRYLHALSRYH